MQTPRLRIGTRGSRLALAQARETRRRLVDAHGFGEDEIEIVAITTTGDQVRDRPLAEIGGKGLFTKEIEEALIAGEVDLAVHSMKDMPSVLPEGLVIGALLEREDPRDAFLSPLCKRIADLPQGATVGSSSVRRTAQLKRIRPDLTCVNFRGNVDTRLMKLARGDVAATLLACAGLNRLGLGDRITAPIDIDEMLPAVAQGAIGVEIRENDERVRALVAPINHMPTSIAVSCERAFLAVLDGSCRTPIAGHARLVNGTLHFRGEALMLDGSATFEAARAGSPEDAARMGREAGAEVKFKGGERLLLGR
ncbi:MAG: hydroxymethylbilane synthase [Parvibaculaceae bacterium]